MMETVTPNSIGDSTSTGAYEVGPQGQVNELTDLYDTVLSQDNGLGTFYWEGAWIPVKAGWTNFRQFILSILARKLQ